MSRPDPMSILTSGSRDAGTAEEAQLNATSESADPPPMSVLAEGFAGQTTSIHAAQTDSEEWGKYFTGQEFKQLAEIHQNHQTRLVTGGILVGTLAWVINPVVAFAIGTVAAIALSKYALNEMDELHSKGKDMVPESPEMRSRVSSGPGYGAAP